MNNKNLTLLTLCLLISNVLFAQFSIGDTFFPFTDPARANRSVPTYVFYPANSAGNNVAPAVGEFPVISFGHGFSIGWQDYTWVADALVPCGYIVAFPDTETGSIAPPPDHAEFGRDIAFVVQAIQAEGLNSGSVLFNAVGSTAAFAGHSMGGGCSFLATTSNPSIDAVFNFAAAETNNASAIAAAGNYSGKVLIIEGSDDCVTPSAGNTGDMYNGSPSNCKSKVNITGASHCQFASNNGVCTLGELFCSSGINLATQEQLTIDWVKPFVDLYLKNDCSAASTWNDLVAASAGVDVVSNCNVSAGVNVSGGTIIDETCNQMNGSISGVSATGSGLVYTWTDSNGNIVGNTVSIMNLSADTYTLEVSDNSGCSTQLDFTVSNIPGITLSGGQISDSNCGGFDGSITGIQVNGNLNSVVWTDANNNTIGTTLDIQNLGPGIYTITVTDDNGCEEQASFTVTDTSVPNLSGGTISDENCGNMDGSIIGITDDAGSPAYTWTDSNGATVGNTLDINNLSAGTYTLTVVDNSTGCVVSNNYTVSGTAAASASFSGLPSSTSSATPIGLSGTPSGGTFSSPSGGIIFNSFNPALVSPGIHNVTYSYSDSNGCSADDTQSVLVIAITYSFINYTLGTIAPGE